MCCDAKLRHFAHGSDVADDPCVLAGFAPLEDREVICNDGSTNEENDEENTATKSTAILSDVEHHDLTGSRCHEMQTNAAISVGEQK